MVAGSGCWQTRCCWWLCPGCATHPLSARLTLLLSHPGRNSLFVGISTFLARRAYAGTAQSPVTTCKPHTELSFPEPALRKWMVPRDPLPSVSKKKSACTVGPLPQVATQGFRGVAPVGSLLSTLAAPGQSMSAHTCLWSVR